MRWHESDVLRVSAIGGATAAFMGALAFANPFTPPLLIQKHLLLLT